MFDYDGDITASHDDFQSLLTKVIQETFPTSKCIVRIRQTKAMPHPKISISIADGPVCADLMAAIPLLSEISSPTRWAYCGKVLPALDCRLRANRKSTFIQHSQMVWQLMHFEDPTVGIFPSRSRPRIFAKYRQRLSDYVKNIHPASPSPTMALIERGTDATIEQIAVNQRRDDLARATPSASTVTDQGAPHQPRRVRL